MTRRDLPKCEMPRLPKYVAIGYTNGPPFGWKMLSWGTNKRKLRREVLAEFSPEYEVVIVKLNDESVVFRRDRWGITQSGATE